MARVRARNSVNLKPGGIIEPLLKLVNVLRMRPRLGVVHSDQPDRHAWLRRHPLSQRFYHIWQSQQKGLVRLKMF